MVVTEHIQKLNCSLLYLLL